MSSLLRFSIVWIVKAILGFSGITNPADRVKSEVPNTDTLRNDQKSINAKELKPIDAKETKQPAPSKKPKKLEKNTLKSLLSQSKKKNEESTSAKLKLDQFLSSL